MTSGLRASRKASSFTESVIRDMTRLANEHGAINLGQGFPDFPAPDAVKDAAARAIAEGFAGLLKPGRIMNLQPCEILGGLDFRELTRKGVFDVFQRVLDGRSVLLMRRPGLLNFGMSLLLRLMGVLKNAILLGGVLRDRGRLIQRFRNSRLGGRFLFRRSNAHRSVECRALFADASAIPSQVFGRLPHLDRLIGRPLIAIDQRRRNLCRRAVIGATATRRDGCCGLAKPCRVGGVGGVGLRCFVAHQVNSVMVMVPAVPASRAAAFWPGKQSKSSTQPAGMTLDAVVVAVGVPPIVNHAGCVLVATLTR
jgi:hypothetical protein